MLKERHDASTQRTRWSLPSKERCICQAVIAVKNDGRAGCRIPGGDGLHQQEDLWFTDEKDQLVRRVNWTPEILNELLERSVACGKLVI